jgi:hypothetical protein
LAFRVLVKAADPEIADALTVQIMILIEFCQVELYDPWHTLSINSDFNPILTEIMAST